MEKTNQVLVEKFRNIRRKIDEYSCKGGKKMTDENADELNILTKDAITSVMHKAAKTFDSMHDLISQSQEMLRERVMDRLINDCMKVEMHSKLKTSDEKVFMEIANIAMIDESAKSETDEELVKVVGCFVALTAEPTPRRMTIKSIQNLMPLYAMKKMVEDIKSGSKLFGT